MIYKIYIPPYFKKILKKVCKKHRSAKEDLTNKLESLSKKLEKITEEGLPLNTYKIRIANTGEKRGKSYGFRLIYHVYKEYYIIPIYFYSKTELTKLSPKHKKQIDQWIKQISEYLLDKSEKGN